MSENNKKIDMPFRHVLRTIPPDYWRLWYVGMVVSTVRWLETVAMGIVVYQQTGSAFVVAMITMLRLLPMGLFGAFLGAFAERFDRRLTLAGVVGLMAVTSATDNPLRRMMMGEVMGSDRMATAMALDVGASNASRMVGPDRRRLAAGRGRHRGCFPAERTDVRVSRRGHAAGPYPHPLFPWRRRRAGPHLGGRGDRPH